MVCRPEYLSVQQVRGPWPAQCWQRLAASVWPLDQIGLIVGRDRFGEVGHRIGDLLPLGLELLERGCCRLV